MDIEHLKDIIIDDNDTVSSIEQLKNDIDIADALKQVPHVEEGAKTELLTAEQLAGDEPLTDEKKKLAAALAAAEELGIIEAEKPMTASTLASTSDSLVEELRGDYQVGSGQIFPEEAHENALDRQASRLTGNIGNMLDRMVDNIGHAADVTIKVWADRAFDWIEEQWPETQAFRPAAEKVVEILDEKVVPVIVEGARKVAAKVKDAVARAAETVKATAKKVGEKVTGFLKGLFS